MQELRPKGIDVRQDELGDLVDKEMAATSAAIEEAVRRIDVSGVNLTVRCTYYLMNLHVIKYSVSIELINVMLWFCL